MNLKQTLRASLFTGLTCLTLACQTTKQPPNTQKETTSKDAKTPRTFSANSIYQLDSQWVDQNNHPRQLSDLEGKYQLVSMIFTNCGYACPRTVLDLKMIEKGLKEDEKKKVNFALITFDVERDTPPVLLKYYKERQLNPQWVLLHGSADQVRELSTILNVKYEQRKNKAFVHSNLITVLNPKGEIIFQQEGLGIPPEAILKKIRDDMPK